MSAHTPEPWTARPLIAGGDNGWRIYTPSGRVLAHVYSEPQAEGNARLMADAPEMLAALRSLYNELEGLEEGLSNRALAALENARAVLARATGAEKQTVVEADTLLDTLDNVTASLETMMAHFGDKLSRVDRLGKEENITAARAAIAKAEETEVSDARD